MAASAARTVEEARSTFTAARFGSSSRLRALTVKDSSPRYPGEGCSLIVTETTSESTPSRTGERVSSAGSMMASSASVSPVVVVSTRLPTTPWSGVISTVSTTGSSAPSSVSNGMIPSRLPSMSTVGSPSVSVPASWPMVVSTTMSTFAAGRLSVETAAGSSMVTPTVLNTSSIRTWPARSDTVPRASVTAPVISPMVSSSRSSVFAGSPFRPSAPPSCSRSTVMTPSARSIETRPLASVSGSSRSEVLAWSSAASRPVRPMVPPPASTETRPMSRSISAAWATSPSTPSVPTAASSPVPTSVTAPLSSVARPPTSGESMTSWPLAITYSEETSPSASVAVEPRAPSSRESSLTIWSLSPSTPAWDSNVVRSTCALP